MNIDKCVECDKPSGKIRLITGDDIEFWCEDHLLDAGISMLRFINKETQNIIFGATEHEIWYWGLDIQSGLSDVICEFLTALACDLNADTELIRINADLVTIKAKEYHGAIETPKHLRETLANMPKHWLSRSYVEAIGEPFGQKTFDIVNEYRHKLVNGRIARDLVCMVLAAKRAESYKSHKYSEQLIAIEETLWITHRENLK